MEALYTKLYDKYTKLKKRKESETEHLNHEQEVKFMNYVSAAEDLIEHLRNENQSLHERINDLTNQVTSIRSDKETQMANYQKLMIEENQKNKELSEEVERLQTLQIEGLCCSSKGRNNEHEPLESPEGTQFEPIDLSNTTNKRMKRSRQSGSRKKEAKPISFDTDQVERAVVRESDALEKIQQPESCKGDTGNSGGSINDSGPASSMFQSLLECLIGMKFSTAHETKGSSLSVVHQSSGYSFSLTWVSKMEGEEAELLYHVTSLGTFERVAPEWMREVLMFSIRMCPIFFERVSRVIKLHN